MSTKPDPVLTGEELKACPNPWCMARTPPLPCALKRDGWVVRCACGVVTFRKPTEAEAIAAWNTRAQPPIPFQPGEGMVMVPYEPTAEMIEAAAEAEFPDYRDFAICFTAEWKAAIHAALLRGGEDGVEGLRELSEKAEAGPWFVGRLDGEEDNQAVSIGPYDLSDRPNKPHHYEDTIAEAWENGNLTGSAEDNAAFIVACVNHVRQALAAIGERVR